MILQRTTHIDFHHIKRVARSITKVAPFVVSIDFTLNLFFVVGWVLFYIQEPSGAKTKGGVMALSTRVKDGGDRNTAEDNNKTPLRAQWLSHIPCPKRTK